jgi:hypothetical protein
MAIAGKCEEIVDRKKSINNTNGPEAYLPQALFLQ